MKASYNKALDELAQEKAKNKRLSDAPAAPSGETVTQERFDLLKAPTPSHATRNLTLKKHDLSQATMEDRLRKMGAEADRRIDAANAKTLAAEQRARDLERALEKAREELSICQEDVSDLERLSEKDAAEIERLTDLASGLEKKAVSQEAELDTTRDRSRPSHPPHPPFPPAQSTMQPSIRGCAFSHRVRWQPSVSADGGCMGSGG